MKTPVLFLAVACLVMIGQGAAAQEQRKELNPEAHMRTGFDRPTTGDPFIVMDDRFWTTELSDEPLAKLTDALDHLKAGKDKKAARDIQKAAAHLHIASLRTKDELKKELVSSREQLLALADSVEHGNLTDPASLDMPFARALTALAAHHIDKANLYWTDRKSIQAGYELKAGALDMQQAAEWTGKGDDPEIGNLVYKAKTEADHLIAEEPENRDAVAKTLTDAWERVCAMGSVFHPNG